MLSLTRLNYDLIDLFNVIKQLKFRPLFSDFPSRTDLTLKCHSGDNFSL